ncbi:MAG: peptidylprolyl isomerase [Hyphomonas sp.]|uniref:peptidylprolyl isomerase n=1 Tax=Hyphomonas sp. TaxID=87 RepID=UPI0035282710
MADTSQSTARWRAWLSEPLFHFIIAALAVFIGWNAINGSRSDAERTIRITQTDLERLAALYAAESGALPSQQDMAAMVNDYVRDEALAREARSLGLDDNDTIVTRRLAQKMTFMISDLADDPDPDEKTLRAWHESHPDRFTDPQTLTFTHVYFSEDVRGETAETDAAAALDGLNAGEDWRNAGDPFMLQRSYGDLPIREVARLFGPDFARTLAALPASDSWTGPIRSALGVHLVRVTANVPARLIPFEEVREAVLADWKEETRRQENEEAVRDIIAKYKVEIEGSGSK